MSRSTGPWTLILVFSLVLRVAHAATYFPPGAICEEYSIPVAIETQAYTYNGTEWHNNYELVDFVTVQVGRIGKTPRGLYAGPNNFSAGYDIGATFCSPKDTTKGKEKTVLLATHGLWFERK